MAQRPAKLDWQPCVDDNDEPSLIAYARGYVCVSIHKGRMWSILKMDKLGGTVVLSGTNPPGPISVSRTAGHVNRKFAALMEQLEHKPQV